MYSLPEYPDTEGQSDENPIFLEGVQYTNFERFLMVFYPLSHVKPVETTEEWSSVLKLASLWLFNGIRDLAISKLDILVVDLEPLDQVALGRTHRNTSWFMAGLTQLVRATSSELPHRTAFVKAGWNDPSVYRLWLFGRLAPSLGTSFAHVIMETLEAPAAL